MTDKLMTDKCLTERHKIGDHVVDMTIGVNGFIVEWGAEINRDNFSRKDLKRYKKLRNKLIRRFADETGVRLGIIDL